MKHLCWFTFIIFFTMTACLHSFAAPLSENVVESSSETEIQASPVTEVQAIPKNIIQASPENQSSITNDVQSISGKSQSVNQNAKRDLINELQEIITENQQYEEFLQELDSTLKELRKKTSDRLKKKPDAILAEVDTVPKTDTKAAFKPKGLGRWWLRSSLSYDPLPTQILNHLELSYNFSRMTGNLTVDKHVINTLIVTRYKRFTNYLNYTFDKRNSARAYDYPEGTKIIEVNFEIRDSTKHLVTEELRFAILKQLFTAVGFMYEEDNFVSLDKRITAYLGFGGRPIQTDHFMLKFFTALGHEEKDYTKDYHEFASYFTEEERSVLMPDYETGTVKSDIFYCDQIFNWSITDDISFREKLMTFIDTDDSDKYRWTLDLGLEYQFTKHLSLMLNYNEFFDKAMNPLMGRKRDISKGVFVKVIF